MDCDEDDDNDDNNNEDNGDGDDEHDNDGSLSGSDDNEKSCSWNGSNNESESINGSDSINGDTSGDARSSASSSSSSSSKNNHSSGICSNLESGSGSSRSHNSSGSGSGSGGDSPVPKHASTNWKKVEGFNYGTKPQHTKQPSTYNTKLQHVTNAYPAHTSLHSSKHIESASSSQSVESYNHGGVTNSNSNNTSSPVPGAASKSSMLSHTQDIRSSLDPMDYVKGEILAAPLTRKITTAQPAFIQQTGSCEMYSLSLGPKSADSRQIDGAIPEIPQEVNSPKLFSPISLNSNTSATSMHQIPVRNVDGIRGTMAPLCRNFPSWYSSNSSEPL